MSWAVHSLHAPSVEINEQGEMKHGKDTIPLPEPLFVAETRDEAETWRNTRLSQTR